MFFTFLRLRLKTNNNKTCFIYSRACSQWGSQSRLQITTLIKGPWIWGLCLLGITLICFDKAKFYVQSSRFTSAELAGRMRQSPNPTDAAAAAIAAAGSHWLLLFIATACKSGQEAGMPFGGLNTLLWTAQQPAPAWHSWFSWGPGITGPPSHLRPGTLKRTHVGVYTGPVSLGLAQALLGFSHLWDLEFPQNFPQIKRTNKLYYKNKQNLFLLLTRKN